MKIVGALMLMIAASTACKAVEAVSRCPSGLSELEKAKVSIPSHMSGRVVVGEGRSYFYTSPDERCRMKRLFVIPGDRVEAYFDVPGWTQVTFWNAKGGDVSGWISNSRLKETGTGIGPNYEKQ